MTVFLKPFFFFFFFKTFIVNNKFEYFDGVLLKINHGLQILVTTRNFEL